MTYDKQCQAYTNNSHMVRKTKQVVMLYEGAIRFLQQAKAAIEEQRIEDRFNMLTKASDVVTGLQLSLDKENGGDIANLLDDYYSGLDMRIMSLHQSNDLTMLDMCVRHLKMMKEAWEEIDHNHEEDDAGSFNDYVTVGEKNDSEIDMSDPEVSQKIMSVADSINVRA